MVTEKPNVSPSGRYTTKVTCEFLQISRTTLNNHRKLGHIRCGISKNNGRSFYLGSEILRFWGAQY